MSSKLLTGSVNSCDLTYDPDDALRAEMATQPKDLPWLEHTTGDTQHCSLVLEYSWAYIFRFFHLVGSERGPNVSILQIEYIFLDRS